MQADIRGDTKAVLRDIGYRVPDLSRKAQVTALNKTNAKVGTQFRRALGRETGIKQKDFKPQVKLFRATYNRKTAKTWFGMRRGIRLAVLTKSPTGKFDSLARGTLHGRSGADAFSAKVLTGNKGASSTTSTGFFVRKGKQRLPISQVRIKFDSVGESVLEKAVTAVGPNEFKQQFAYDLKRRLARTSKSSRRAGSRRR